MVISTAHMASLLRPGLAKMFSGVYGGMVMKPRFSLEWYKQYSEELTKLGGKPAPYPDGVSLLSTSHPVP